MQGRTVQELYDEAARLKEIHDGVERRILEGRCQAFEAKAISEHVEALRQQAVQEQWRKRDLNQKSFP